ncbi:MAG: hypothetical protein P4L55_10920, partial [Syntrophobacteraceae bacterium]|nr:hypothetical protein [Syntrophobacteraceae bacterium]
DDDMMRPMSVVAAPPAPTSLTAVKSGGNGVLTWKTNNIYPNNFTNIVVQRATSSGFTTGLKVTTLAASATGYTDKTIGTGHYYYRVYATETFGSGVAGYPSVTQLSGFSNVANF